MRLKHFLSVFLTLLTLSVGQMWGTDATVALTTSNSSLSSSGITVNSNIAIAFGEGTYGSLPSVGSTYTKIYAGNTITFTPTNATITQVVMTASNSSYIKTWDKSAGTSMSVSSSTATWKGSQTSSFTLTNSASGQARITQIAITYTVNASYTVTWTINPAAGGTLSATSGTSTTVTPNSAYTYGSPAYTVTSGTATVSQSTNTFTATPTENCSIRINMVEKPKYTVTLKDDNDTRTQASYGATVSLPERAGCTGYTFAGWTKSWTSAQNSWTTTAPTIIPAGSYTPTEDVNLYPVYTKTESGGEPETVTIFEETCSSRPTSTTSITNSDTNWDDTGGNLTGVSISGSARTYNSGITNPPCFGFTSTNYKDLTISGINTNGYSNLTLSYLIKGSQSGGTYATYTVSTNAVSNNSVELTTSGTATTCSTENTLSSLSIPATSSLTLTFTAGSNITNRAFYVDNIKITGQTGGSTTSYISVPNCCIPLGQINGSFS